MIPRRLPGEPPWLWTVPPARFVAVRTDPTPEYYKIHIDERKWILYYALEVNRLLATWKQRVKNNINQRQSDM